MQQPASAKVSGHLVDIPNLLLLNVLLTGASGPPMETAAKLDGSFEFTGVPSGSYTLRAPGAASVAVTVQDRDLTIDLRPEYEGAGVKLGGTVEGVENLASGRTPTVVLSRLTSHVSGLAIPPTFEITGHLEIVAAPGQDVGRPARMRMTFRSANLRSGVVVQPDGTFAVTLTEGEYAVYPEDLPDGYSLRSITSGAIDLTTSAMRLEAGMNPPEPIRVVLQCKTA